MLNEMLTAEKMLLRNWFLSNCGGGEETLYLLRAVVLLGGAGWKATQCMWPHTGSAGGRGKEDIG